MQRRDFLKRSSCNIGAAMMAAGMGFGTAVPSSTANRPNIIFILTDDQRWDTMGCAGNPIIQTPVMDSLAKNGIRFDKAFVTSPACAPSRATIYTGLYERTHDWTFGRQHLAKVYTDTSFPVHLRNAGYRTGIVGKWDTRTEDNDARKKMFDYEYLNNWPYFKEIDGKQVHLTNVFGDKAVQFIQDSKSEQPFFLSLCFHAPHAENQDPEQFYWPPSCDDLYKDVTIPETDTMDAEFFETQPEYLKNHFNRIDRWFRRFDTREKYQKMIKGYYRMISGIDIEIGKILKELKNLAIDDNTIIILMGDNGYFLGERGFGGKFLLYEPSIRVPLIIYDPRKDASRRNIVQGQMALNLDIAPTILDMAGVAIPAEMQGRSLMPLLNGEKVDWRTDFICEYDCKEFDTIRSEGLRTEKWKYIRYMDYPDSEELYDIENDPMEKNNLAKNALYRKQLIECRTRCDTKIKKILNDRKQKHE